MVRGSMPVVALRLAGNDRANQGSLITQALTGWWTSSAGRRTASSDPRVYTPISRAIEIIGPSEYVEAADSPMRVKTTITAVLMAAMLSAHPAAMAYEQAFPKTPEGEVTVRTLPAGRIMTTAAEGSYFEQSGRLFSRLFDYIRANDVSMTVPVEGDLDRAAMRFYAGSDAPGDLADTDAVRVETVPERTVASIGGQGAYSEGNLKDALGRLEAWLISQDRWRADGEPYAVYWNGPFTPWFMKRFEVHLPVAEAKG